MSETEKICKTCKYYWCDFRRDKMVCTQRVGLPDVRANETCYEWTAQEAAETTLADSGDRTQFETGAVRDMHGDKGDMVSIPWEAILRLSKHYEAGAKKYERFNYRKGINLSSYIDSACRHLAKYQCGCDDEDHLSAAAFNVLGAMLVEEIQPELIDLPLRKDKRRFRYFGEENGGAER